MPFPHVILAVEDVSLYRYYVTGMGPFISAMFFELGVVTIILILLQILECRPSRGVPSVDVEAVRDQLAEGKTETPRSICLTNPSLFAEVLAAGFARLPNGLEAARIAAVSRLDVLRRNREFGLFLLRLIVIIAPLLGFITTSARVSAAVMAMEEDRLFSSPRQEDMPFVIGHRMTPLVPAAIITLVAVVATSLLQQAHDRIALRVRFRVENMLMDMCQQYGRSVDGAVRAAQYPGQRS